MIHTNSSVSVSQNASVKCQCHDDSPNYSDRKCLFSCSKTFGSCIFAFTSLYCYYCYQCYFFCWQCFQSSGTNYAFYINFGLTRFNPFLNCLIWSLNLSCVPRGQRSEEQINNNNCYYHLLLDLLICNIWYMWENEQSLSFLLCD